MNDRAFLKFVTSLLFTAISAVFLCASLAGADPYGAEDAYWVHYVTPAAITNSTAAVIVDISSTTAWPHKRGSAIRVIGADITADQVAAGTATIKLGVVTSVNPSSGTVSWFETLPTALNVSNTQHSLQRRYSPAPLNTRVVSADTPYLLVNDKTTTTTNDTQFFASSWTVVIPSVIGQSPVGVGDIVAEIQAGASNGTIVDINLGYYVEP